MVDNTDSERPFGFAFSTGVGVSFRTMGLLLVLGTTSMASALDKYKVTVKNTTGAAVNDIHLVFTGTGNSMVNRVVLNPGGGVILNPAVGNEFNASFNNLANNANFVGTFLVNPGSIAFNSGWWTLNGVQGQRIDVKDVTLQAVPEPASLAALSLAALTLARRRRRTA